jgi:hypothetical protein
MAAVVKLICNTKTKQGLKVHCVIDKNKYKTEIKVNDDWSSASETGALDQ